MEETEGSHPVLLAELAELEFAAGDFAACAAFAERACGLAGYWEEVPRIDLLRIRALHHLGRMEEAIAHAEAVLARDPKRAEIRAALATLCLDDERVDQARRLYAEGSAGAAMPPELEWVGGYLALSAEDTDLAQRRFDWVLAQRPQEGRALLGAGLTAAARNDLPQAIEKLRMATAAMPNHLGTSNALAWMLLLSGDLDGAETTLRQALAVDDSFAETHGTLAVVAALRDDRASAQASLRRAVGLDRDCLSAAYAGLVLQHGKANRAALLEPLLDALAKRPARGMAGSMRDVALRSAQRTRGGKASAV